MLITQENLGLENANNFYLFDAILKGPTNKERAKCIENFRNRVYVENEKYNVWSKEYHLAFILEKLGKDAVVIKGWNTLPQPHLGDIDRNYKIQQNIISMCERFNAPLIIPEFILWEVDHYAESFNKKNSLPCVVVVHKDKPIDEAIFIAKT